MTTTRINTTFISVQSAKPTYSYRNPQYPPLQNGASRVLVRATMPSLPAGAIITGAKLWVNQTGTWSGSNTLSVRRNFATWTNLVTWATMPTLGDTVHSKTQSGTTPGTWWDFDVTADVQGFFAHTKTNWGWALYTTSATRRNVRGSTAPELKPYLEVTYELPSKVPSDLSPQGGAVSVDKPVLTFTTEGSTTAIQVQIDPASDAVSADFDSGEVAATGGVLDLTGTAYAGLADGDATFWRARAKTASGWSPWSQWVSFSHVDLPTVTLTSPSATPADTSPPFEWTVTGGTQAAWEAALLGPSGGANLATIDKSGVVSGAADAWTPTRGLASTGQSGEAIVRVWDDVVRVATPGAPTYAEDTVGFVVDFDGTVDPMDTLTATQARNVPGINLAGTRAGGAPDEVAIFRDGVLVVRLVGTDVFTGTAFAWTDWTAPMNAETTYRVAPVTNGSIASDGPTVTVTPRCQGLWLVNPETDVRAVLWGVDEGSWNQDDIATTHVVVSGSTVRRRLARALISGSISGDIIASTGNLGGQAAADALEVFAQDDAGVVYRFIAGHLNIPVIIGNILVTPRPVAQDEIVARGSFSFWGV